MSNVRVLLAPDSFKGSLSAPEVATALAEGIRQAQPLAVCIEHPLADGGEGTVNVLAAAGFDTVEVPVVNHRGEEILALLASHGDLVVVESAQACPFTPDATAADALSASTRGVGMMIAAALDRGASRIYLAVGGTATTDGGAGMLAALGAQFVDNHGRVIPDGGGALIDIDSIDLRSLDSRLAEVEIVLLSDVDNPLLGESGAATVFAPQKGADRVAVTRLEEGLSHFARLLALNEPQSLVPGQAEAWALLHWPFLTRGVVLELKRLWLSPVLIAHWNQRHWSSPARARLMIKALMEKCPRSSSMPPWCGESRRWWCAGRISDQINQVAKLPCLGCMPCWISSPMSIAAWRTPMS